MPFTTPFHSRTAPLNYTQEWRDWSGYMMAALYEPSHEREYYAVRNSAALFDVSPLYKYEIAGPDALALVNRIMTRDFNKCAIGQVMYSPWCDDEGKVIDDGTVARLEENRFRLTAATHNLRWFQDCGLGLKATVTDVSLEMAALALQGPHARNILKRVVSGIDLDTLKFFRLAEGQAEGFPITVTRTGYTGDLGYELWVAPQHAERLWDLLLERGQAYGIAPTGLVALDIVRIEAGFPLIEIDYIPAPKALIEPQKSSPFEIGLGWAVALNKDYFVGRPALVAEKARGSHWAFVGLEVHWPDIEALYHAFNLTPLLTGRAVRLSVPVYKDERQIGQATSRTFSPLLKQYIALATIEAPYGEVGAQVELEMTIEFQRKVARATVVKLPFFDPLRKRA
jgi:aminomethyltransferase